MQTGNEFVDDDDKVCRWLNEHAYDLDGPRLANVRLLGKADRLFEADARGTLVLPSEPRPVLIDLDLTIRDRFGYVMNPRAWERKVDFYVAFAVIEVGVWIAEHVREEYAYGIEAEEGGRIRPITVPQDRRNPSGVAYLLTDPEFHWTADDGWSP